MAYPTQTTERKRGILLVDDEQRDLDAVSAVLEDAGYAVFQAETSTRALEVAQENFTGIDFVVTDIALPGLNGVELHKALCELKPNLCNVLFISARSGSEVLRFYGLSISDPHFLAKPFSGRELVERVDRLMKAQLPLQIKVS